MITALEFITSGLDRLIPFELLVELLGKSTLILLVALLAVIACRRCSAAVRSYILAITILGVALLPAVTTIIPDWHVAAVPSLTPTPTALVEIPLGSGEMVANNETVSNISLSSPAGFSFQQLSWQIPFLAGGLCVPLQNQSKIFSHQRLFDIVKLKKFLYYLRPAFNAFVAICCHIFSCNLQRFVSYFSSKINLCSR